MRMRLKTTMSPSSIATGLELSGPLQTGIGIKTYHTVCVPRLYSYTMRN